MKTKTMSVCAALLAAALSCIVPETAHAIQGDPIPGVDVSIEQSPGGISIASDSSNGDGYVGINGITEGIYVVHVTLPSYVSNNYNSARSNTAGIVMSVGGNTVLQRVVSYDPGKSKSVEKQIVIPHGTPQNIAFSFSIHTPNNVWSTLAGAPGQAGTIDGTGSNARFTSPRGVAVDASENIYVADTYDHLIRKVTPGGVVTTLAGGGSGFADGPGSSALFKYPFGIAIDASGNLYVADTLNNAIRKVSPAGDVTTLAGGSQGSADGTGSSAQFYYPEGVAVDSGSNVYVAEFGNHTIRKVTPDGVVTTLAGLAGNPGRVDGTGSNARFNGPQNLTVDKDGNVFVADTDNHTIRKVAPGGVVTTLAGTAGGPGVADGTGIAAEFHTPRGIFVNADGNILVGDSANDTIRQVTPDGIVTTLAGSAGTAGSADGSNSTVRFNYPQSIAQDASGNLYVADGSNNTIRKDTFFAEVSVSTEVSPLLGGFVTGGGFYLVGDAVNLVATPNAGYNFAGWTSGTSLVSGSANYSFTASTNQSLVANFVFPIFTDAATDVSFASATFNGHLDAGGTVTNPRFEWGTTTAYGHTTPATANQASQSGLVNNTTYHYRFVADVDGFSQYGADVSFDMLHNDAPIAVDDLYYFPTNPGPQTLNVLTNDSDPDGGTLHIVGVSQATGGRVAIVSGSTALLYTPSSRYSGNDSFIYKISDGFGGTSTATVRIRNRYLNFAGVFQTLLTNGDPAHDGYVSVTLRRLGSFTGSLKIKTSNVAYSFNGSMDATGHATITIPRTNLTVTLAMDFDGGGFTASVNDGTPTRAPTGNFTANVPYTATNPAPQSGKFTMVIPAPEQTGTTQATASATVTSGTITGITMTNNGAGYISQPTIKIIGTGGTGAIATAVLSNGQIIAINVKPAGKGYPRVGTTVTIDPPSGLPKGIGWATVSVSDLGAILITGKLCDGQFFTAGSNVDANWSAKSFPYAGAQQNFTIFASVPYPSLPGIIYGTFNFRDEPNVSDFDGTLNWWKPAQTTAGIFRGGFTLAPMAIGSAYTPPAAGEFVLDLDATTPNAEVTLADGNLSGKITKNVSIGAASAVAASSNIVTVDNTTGVALSMTITGATGYFANSLTRTINGVASAPAFSGVLFQKQNLGGGVFVGPSQSGSVLIWPTRNPMNSQHGIAKQTGSL